MLDFFLFSITSVTKAWEFPPLIHLDYKYKEKFVILKAIGIMQIKSKETRVVVYTCRYSSASDIPLLVGPNPATATN